MRDPLYMNQLNPLVWMQIEEELEKGEFVHVHDKERLDVFTLAKRFDLYFVMRTRGRAKVFGDFGEMIEYMEGLRETLKRRVA